MPEMDFGEQISEWTRKAEHKMDRVVQETVRDIGDSLVVPRKSGRLQRSEVISVNDGDIQARGMGAIQTVSRYLKAGDVIVIGFGNRRSVFYAHIVEKRRQFMKRVADQLPNIVRRAVERVRREI